MGNRPGVCGKLHGFKVLEEKLSFSQMHGIKEKTDITEGAAPGNSRKIEGPGIRYVFFNSK